MVLRGWVGVGGFGIGGVGGAARLVGGVVGRGRGGGGRGGVGWIVVELGGVVDAAGCVEYGGGNSDGEVRRVEG